MPAPLSTDTTTWSLRAFPKDLILGCLTAAMKWTILYAVVELSLWLGRRSPLGPGALGMTLPLLVLEARLSARRHWRIRVFHLLAALFPSASLIVLSNTMLSSCCFCDNSPGARAFRATEFLGVTFTGALHCLELQFGDLPLP